jgi:trans-2,3-dihydro-3-hydroxyanthranilate isomerase
MQAYEFYTVDVFTDQRFGGNPLAVFPAAPGLSEVQMQSLAREFNLSETTFVFPPADPAHTARVRIFTPAAELPFAGHPNVGTAFVLARLQPNPADTLLFEEAAGLVAVELRRDREGTVTGAMIAAPQPLRIGREIPPEVVAACASLHPQEIERRLHPPIFAGVGIDFAIVELASREALARASPDLAAFREAAQRFPAIGNQFLLHLYVRDAADPNHLAVRMFAPLFGILEDPATGSANATLAALLAQLTLSGQGGLTFDIEQGAEMGRPSRLSAAAHKSTDGSTRATVAGNCVPVLHGHAEV